MPNSQLRGCAHRRSLSINGTVRQRVAANLLEQKDPWRRWRVGLRLTKEGLETLEGSEIKDL
jgi:hypothetical protein